jgi:hypothetical protein
MRNATPNRTLGAIGGKKIAIQSDQWVMTYRRRWFDNPLLILPGAVLLGSRASPSTKNKVAPFSRDEVRCLSTTGTPPMPETPKKLCKDCRWAGHLVPESYGELSELSVNWECHHPFSLMPSRPNLVTGAPVKPMYMTCASARGSSINSEGCGVEGKLWEPVGDIGFGNRS